MPPDPRRFAHPLSTLLVALALWAGGPGCGRGGTTPQEPPELDSTPPGLPREVRAQAGDGVLLLTWRNPEDADLAQIELSGTQGAAVSLRVSAEAAQPVALGPFANDVPVTELRLRAVDTSGNRSEPTAPISATPRAAVASAPSELQVGLDNGRPRLTWQAPLGEAWTSIGVHRASGSGSFARLATVPGDSTAYLDAAVAPGTSYTYYLVAAQAGRRDSDESERVSIMTPTPQGRARPKVLISPAIQPRDLGKWSAPTLNALPGDAISISLGESWRFFRPDESFTAAQIQSQLSPFSAVTKEKFLMVLHEYDPPNPMLGISSGANAAYWAAWLDKWSAFAAAAKAAGFTGLIYDEENYDPPLGAGDLGGWRDDWHSYPGTYYAGYSQAAVEATLRQLGNLVGARIAAVWPTCKLLMYHPPDTSYAGADQISTQPEYGWPIGAPGRRNLAVSDHTHVGAGAFQVGVLQALHPVGGMVQGSGEMFALRSREEFSRMMAYRKNVLLPNATFVPPAFRATYQTQLKLAFFVGDFGFALWHFPSLQVPMSPSVYASTLRNALAVADEGSYVIAYMQEGAKTTGIRDGTYVYLESVREALSGP